MSFCGGVPWPQAYLHTAVGTTFSPDVCRQTTLNHHVVAERFCQSSLGMGHRTRNCCDHASQRCEAECIKAIHPCSSRFRKENARNSHTGEINHPLKTGAFHDGILSLITRP